MPPSLGKSLGEILKKLYGHAVPDLYPKLEMGSRPLKGTEAEDFLKAADLKALPPLFYGGEQGLGLVAKDGAKFVPNPAADIAKEVLDYLVGEHGYGNKESRTGKALEKKFGGIGYGWDRDMLRLILAVLFRAGSIEITHGGEKFDDYQDPRSRTPLVNNTAFKSALFTPVKPIDLPTLKRAVESYEDLTGDTVDMDKAAIAEALKTFAAEEMKRVLPVEAQAKAHRLPVLGTVEEYRDSLTSIESGSADDCVTILAGGGASLKAAHDRVRKIADCLDEKGLAAPPQRPACGGRDLEPARSPGADRPPATGRGSSGNCCLPRRSSIRYPRSRRRPRRSWGPTARCTRPATPTGRSSSGRRSRRSRGGRNGPPCPSRCGSRCCVRSSPAAARSWSCRMARWRARRAGRR